MEYEELEAENLAIGRATWSDSRASQEFVGAQGLDSEIRATEGEVRAELFQEGGLLRYGTYVDFAREEFWNQFGLFHIYSGDPLWPVFAEKMA